MVPKANVRRFALIALLAVLGLLVPAGAVVGSSPSSASASAIPSGDPAATQLAITTHLFLEPFTVGVSVEDGSGNVLTSDNTDVVTLSKVISSDGSGIACPGDPVTVTSGVATFSCHCFTVGT
jgi:hypothetical protein